MKNKFKNTKRCLLINKGKILDKILEGSKFHKLYRPVLYDSDRQKRSITFVVEVFKIRTIVIETSKVRNFKPDMIEELVKLRLQGIIIYEAEDFYELVNGRIPIVKLQSDEYLGDEIFSIRMRLRNRLFKRFFDLLFVLLLSPLAIPLVFIGCLLTCITSKGGMFFSQTRIGKEGKEFKIHKIRTMVVNDGGYTTANDSRITPVGKFLRLSKIDELPQLYNILRGDMSVIGPRPELPQYVDEYSKENPFFSLRHMIKPGVSGWAQIYLPKATPKDNLKKLEYDLYYIKKYSWKLDLKVLIETVKIVLTFNSH